MILVSGEDWRTGMVDSRLGEERLGGEARLNSRRLSDALLGDSQFSLSTLAAVPSNYGAVETGLKFAHSERPFVALLGPSGWGKTHLIEALGGLMHGADERRPVVMTALAWVDGLPRTDSAGPLLLDEVQDIERRPKARQMLRAAVERRVLLRRPTLLSFAGKRPTRLMREVLGNARMWEVAMISEPTPEERELVVARMAASASMALHRSIARVIALHLHGNGRSIIGALRRLQLAKADWSSEQDLSRACGILMPYLIGRDGWDIRDVAYEAVLEAVRAKGLYAPGLVDEIFCWLMLNDVGLREDEVGAFLKISPSRAYAKSDAVREAARQGDRFDLLRTSREAFRERLRG